MTSEDLRQKFLDFFAKRGHAIIPSASLVPENDSSTLFNTAGMQPLVPYLLGEPHPAGNRLVDVQKCVRTGDIDDVGDNRHLTFFEMLGNWSLGDYFKKEAISWSWEFLTDKTEGLGLDPTRLYVTVFKGEDGIPRDEESISLWQEVFKQAELSNEVATQDELVKKGIRIIPLGKNDNFWIAGTIGPCGGDTEIFYDTRPEEGELSGKFNDLVDSFRLVEIWNNVFMEFNKTTEGAYEPLANKNVDTGMGLERTVAVLNGQATVFDTDLFAPLLEEIRGLTAIRDTRAERIVADHIRTAVFMISDGVVPSNTDRGYILRRILRRAIRYSEILKIPKGDLGKVATEVQIKYKDIYFNVGGGEIVEVIKEEEKKFAEALEDGLKVVQKIFDKKVSLATDKFLKLMSLKNKNRILEETFIKQRNDQPHNIPEADLSSGEIDQATISGKEAFDLYQSYGFPLEMIVELVREKSLLVDIEDYHLKLKKHQELSRQGAEQKFKGGLGGDSEQILKYHTATHLLQQALTEVLGPEVAQKGSNITDERLRFDFTFERKMTEEEKEKVEAAVNEKIQADLPVQKVILPKDEAERTGARHLFGEKYGDQVSIYFIGDKLETAYSKEFCGGPHVEHTGILGTFKIAKEEAVAAGVRRIKAVLK